MWIERSFDYVSGTLAKKEDHSVSEWLNWLEAIYNNVENIKIVSHVGRITVFACVSGKLYSDIAYDDWWNKIGWWEPDKKEMEVQHDQG